MSILIDSLQSDFNTTKKFIVDKKSIWVVAKPYRSFNLLQRIKDAYRIIKGSSIAVHYYEDCTKEII